MKTTATLGAAVVGLGVGAQHAQAYARDARCALRWVWDVDASRMGRCLSEIGQGQAATSFETILADPEVDVVSIASYDDAHFAEAAAALRAGKHVFCEKPLCRSLSEGKALKAAWSERPSLRLGCNLVLRAAPLYRWLREAIASGALGQIYAFDGDYLYGRIHKITEGWRKDVDDYSVMQGGGVHLVDLMLMLVNERPSRVSAVGSRLATRSTAFRYDDFVAATFTFSSGAVGRVTANFGCVHRHQHVLRVFGTEGTFLLDDAGARLHRSRDPVVAPEILAHAPLPSDKGALIPAFVEEIASGRTDSVGPQHEFDVVAACAAVDEALASGGEAAIHYF
ncbi:MAG: Gfo/Idh/MocA family oxidoreductase [Armatimonadetes bacterium]|nr:Gfo/Idh/MocA family oxidoreductase [Armatimonadota bacterium]